MPQVHDLTQLDSYSFEHLVNFIALKVLGNGVTGFSMGADGGRDGYLKGRAPYPSEKECWDGVWYIQSKFHKPNLSSNEQKWLIREVLKEIKSFDRNEKRKRPDIWIIATNIEATGIPNTGSYDKILALVKRFSPTTKVDVWGGRKILDFLIEYPQIAKTYGHFLTPGHILSQLYDSLNNQQKNKKDIIEHLMVSQFKELSYTKLEQAGSISDQRPKIYELFRDLPVTAEYDNKCYPILQSLVSASSNVQKISTWRNFGSNWRAWSKNPKRTRVVLLKGGPGQGKSTVGQYFAQIQRAAFILSKNGPLVPPQITEIANELKIEAEKNGFWPVIPRIPIFIELKDYANWYIDRADNLPKNILEFICGKINNKTSFDVNAKVFRDALVLSSWFVNFDGLDEVPNDLKDKIANEINEFTNELIPGIDADVLVLCSTRPQGYSGQFDDLEASICNLIPLPQTIALSCAEAVLRFNRNDDEAEQSLKILKAAMSSVQVKALMATPLQSHIMAVVVRDGGRPPEKRWELFNNFYSVMKKRESLKDFPDPRISVLLREKDQLLKAIHDRLGICLHAKAEYSQGAEASLNKKEFRILAEQATEMLMDGDIKDTVDTLMEATIERLVFVNTPDSSEYVRFDIRQLQEFFAAEFIHNDIDDTEFQDRFEIICGDAHWREVSHFILSALSHYKKFSTLSIASTILHQLDDDENYKIRTYKKRIAVGSLLTLRLIEEGVLEQDKRIRNLFTKTLSSLWGITETEILKRIVGIKMEQSRNWLLNSMIDSFLELDYSESIACGHLFSMMLIPEHERINAIKARLKEAPDFYWISILTFFDVDYISSKEKIIMPWFLEMVVDMFFSNKTTSNILDKIVSYLSRYESNVLKVIDDMEISQHKRNFLEQFILARHLNHQVTENEDTYCFISLIPCANNWIDNVQFQIDVESFMDEEYSFPVEIFKETFLLHKDKSFSRLRKIIGLFVLNEYHISSVPSGILSMIPLRFDSLNLKKDCQTLMSYSDSDLENYLLTKKIDGRDIPLDVQFITPNNIAFDYQKWSNLCLDYPELALEITYAPFFDFQEINSAIKNNELDFFRPLLNVARKYPEALARHFFLLGDLIRVFPCESMELKGLFLSCSLPQSLHKYIRLRPIQPFIINVESEKDFIPFLASALNTTQELKFVNDNADTLDGTLAQSFLHRFGLNVEYLLAVASNSKEDIILRSSCISLYLNQKIEDKTKAIDDFFHRGIDKLIISLYCEFTSKMMTISVYNFMNDVSSIDARLMEFLGHYSSLIKSDASSRGLIQDIYSRWRERAGSVVYKSGYLEKWLA